jgi:hypothetical protein
MEVGLPPETLRYLRPDLQASELFEAQTAVIDDLIRQRDAADALSALFALWWLA